MTDDDAKKIEADEADEAGVWVVGEISKERGGRRVMLSCSNPDCLAPSVEPSPFYATDAHRSTRAEADAATQRAAEGELAARTEVERLTGDREELTVRLRAVEARLQTAEKAAHEWRERCEGKWDKAHVEAAFRAWLYEGVALDVDALTLEEREAPAWADLRGRIEAEEAGA